MDRKDILASGAPAAAGVEENLQRLRHGHVADRRDAARVVAQLVARDRWAASVALEAIVRALGDADDQVRISATQAVAALASAGVDVGRARPALLGALGGAQEAAPVRRASAELLAQLASGGLEASELPAIVAALGDPDARVRAAASQALRASGALHGLSPEAVAVALGWLPSLVRALDDEEPLVRERIASLLGELVERHRDHATRVLGLLVRPSAVRSAETRQLASRCRRTLSEGPVSTAPPPPPPPSAEEAEAEEAGTPAAPTRPAQALVAVWYRWWSRVASVTLRAAVLGRPAMEDWGRRPNASWSDDLLRERWLQLARWAPRGDEDWGKRVIWLTEIRRELGLRGRSVPEGPIRERG